MPPNEERAGIIEFEGKLPHPYAESLAILDVLRRHPTALTGVSVMAVEVNGAKHCLLTTDAAFSPSRLMALGGKEIAVLDLKKVVGEDIAKGGRSRPHLHGQAKSALPTSGITEIKKRLFSGNQDRWIFDEM